MRKNRGYEGSSVLHEHKYNSFFQIHCSLIGFWCTETYTELSRKHVYSNIHFVDEKSLTNLLFINNNIFLIY